MAKQEDLAAYEIALRMHNELRGLAKPRPEAFGLTVDDVAGKNPVSDPVTASILQGMQHETGVVVPREKS